jgi:hypothetical protein
MATQGLPSWWPTLVARAPLSDDARVFLAALCQLSEEEHDDFAVLRDGITSDAVVAEQEGDRPTRGLSVWCALTLLLTLFRTDTGLH